MKIWNILLIIIKLSFASIYLSDAAQSNEDFQDDVVVPPYPILQFALEPRIPESPLNEASRFYWHCRGNITDDSAIAVYWMKDGVLLYGNEQDHHLSTYLTETRTLQLIGALRKTFHVFPNGTLRIDNVSTDVSGQYQCIITNPKGGLLISNTRNLTVLDTPKITKHPADDYVFVNDSVRFECRAESSADVEYYWKHNGQMIFSSKTYTMGSRHTRYSTASMGSLQITGIVASDQGVYECVATNAARQTLSKQARLTVSTEDSNNDDDKGWLGRPTDTEKFDGELVQFECFYGSKRHAPLSYKWFRYSGGSTREAICDCSSLGETRCNWPEASCTSGNLAFPLSMTSAAEQEEYECEVLGSSGRYRNKTMSINYGGAFLTAKGVKPVVTIGPIEDKIHSARYGLSMSIMCTVTGVPEPKIMWLKNGVPLEPYKPTKGRVIGEMTAGPRVRVTPTGLNVELKIQNAVLDDEGAYQCIAENDAGSDIKTTHFIISQTKSQGQRYFPPAPKGVLVTNVTANTIDIQWDAYNDSSLSLFWIRLESPDYAAFAAPPLTYCDEKTCRFHIHNQHPDIETREYLQPYTKYKIEIVAVVGKRMGLPSDPVYATTSESVPCQLNFQSYTVKNQKTKPVIKIDHQFYSNDDILMRWTPLRKDCRHGKILHYTVTYTLKQADGGGGQQQTSVISAFSAYDEIENSEDGHYYAQIHIPPGKRIGVASMRAATKVGTSNEDFDLYIFTKPDHMPVEEPYNPGCLVDAYFSKEVPDLLQIQWSCEEEEMAVDTYQITIKDYFGDIITDGQHSVDASQTALNVTGLDPWKMYCIEVEGVMKTRSSSSDDDNTVAAALPPTTALHSRQQRRFRTAFVYPGSVGIADQPPKITSARMQEDGVIFLSWEYKPSWLEHQPVDMYNVRYEEISGNSIISTHLKNCTSTNTILDDLNNRTDYRLSVRAIFQVVNDTVMSAEQRTKPLETVWSEKETVTNPCSQIHGLHQNEPLVNGTNIQISWQKLATSTAIDYYSIRYRLSEMPHDWKVFNATGSSANLSCLQPDSNYMIEVAPVTCRDVIGFYDWKKTKTFDEESPECRQYPGGPPGTTSTEAPPYEEEYIIVAVIVGVVVGVLLVMAGISLSLKLCRSRRVENIKALFCVDCVENQHEANKPAGHHRVTVARPKPSERDMYSQQAATLGSLSADDSSLLCEISNEQMRTEKIRSNGIHSHEPAPTKKKKNGVIPHTKTNGVRNHSNYHIHMNGVNNNHRTVNNDPYLNKANANNRYSHEKTSRLHQLYRNLFNKNYNLGRHNRSNGCPDQGGQPLLSYPIPKHSFNNQNNISNQYTSSTTEHDPSLELNGIDDSVTYHASNLNQGHIHNLIEAHPSNTHESSSLVVTSLSPYVMTSSRDNHRVDHDGL